MYGSLILISRYPLTGVMQFSPTFQQVHRTLAKGCGISIEQLASIANPAALGLSAKRDFYEPVRFALKLTHAGDAIVLGVPVAENAGWLAELKRRTAATLAIGGPLGEALEFRTINDTPLEAVAVRALPSVGHLNVYAVGKLVRLPELPSVPIEFSATKRTVLGAWVKDVLSKELPGVVAAELANKEAHEVEAAVEHNGAIFKAIRARMAASATSAQDVARRYHVDSPQTMSAQVADATLDRAARHVLRSVRAYIKAAGPQIKQQIAARKSAAISASLTATPIDAGLHGSVLLDKPAATAAVTPQFFRSLMTDALNVPQMRRAVVETIYRAPLGSLPAGMAPVAAAAVAPKPTSQTIGHHHPWYRHVHETLLPLRGSYPSDYMARHTKQNMSASAPYMGDVLQTYQRYHLFAGRMPVPPGLVVRGGVPQPIECHSHGRHHKKDKKHRERDYMQDQVGAPVAADSRLVPISDILAAGRDLPPLRRLADGHVEPRNAAVQREMRSRLVALNNDDTTDDVDADAERAAILAQGPELPPLEDLFK